MKKATSKVDTADNIQENNSLNVIGSAAYEVMPVVEGLPEGSGITYGDGTLAPEPVMEPSSTKPVADEAQPPFTHPEIDSWDCKTLATRLEEMKYTLNNARLTQSGFQAYQETILYASNLYNSNCQVAVAKPDQVDPVAGTIEPPHTIMTLQPAIEVLQPATDPQTDKINPADSMTPPAITPYVVPVAETVPVNDGGGEQQAAASPAVTEEKKKNWFWYFVGITAFVALIGYKQEK